MKTRTFNFYCDPGHGWLKVPMELIKDLGIAEYITAYSYMRGKFAYLEEDADATLFIDKMKEQGIECKLNYLHSNKRSKIRNYNDFHILSEKQVERFENIRTKLLNHCNWNKKALSAIKNAKNSDLEYWNKTYSLGL